MSVGRLAGAVIRAGLAGGVVGGACIWGAEWQWSRKSTQGRKLLFFRISPGLGRQVVDWRVKGALTQN